MSQKVQSVVRSFEILESLSSEKNGLTIKELSVKTGLNKTTVHRLLSTILSLGYISQDPITTRYRINLRILNLGSKILEEQEIISLAKPCLMKACDLLGETIHLVMKQDDEIIYIDKIENSSNRMKVASHVGLKLPLHSTAVGKIFLSDMTEKEFNIFWKENDHQRYTPHTITAKNTMIDELALIREKGYARDNEENETGLICFAAPIRDRMGETVYAISISTPLFNITEKVEKKQIQIICNTALEISRLLGYSQ